MSTDLYPEVLATLLLFAGLWMIATRVSWSRVSVRMSVVALFMVMNLRYLWWRVTATLPPLEVSVGAGWAWGLLGLELCANLVLMWHFVVLVRPSDRRAEADRAAQALRARDQVPGVDLLIPTYNEPEEILRRTLAAAVRVDYPNVKVWVLDDGCRDWLRRVCAEYGVEHVTREERKGFKAGNLNHALALTHNPLLCVADADCALAPNFLWRTVGLLDDPSIGIVQTPQYFGNPDAIQYNLRGERAWPEAQCMFSDVMQAARDTWDNAFCYGTGFVVRRSCLEGIGGFPEQTITEDLHSSYVLLSHGFKTRFLNERLSEGFATQDIFEFVRQRARWCIGALQCCFVEGGVLRAKRLSVVDRMFFLDPVLYHVGTLWTFFLLLAPAVFWWTGVVPFHSDFGHLFVVFAPRMLLSIYGFYWLTNRKTIPFVSELGRIVGIYYLISAIGKVLLNPFRQTFNITGKKLESTRTQIYWHVMWPHLGLMAAIFAGLGARWWGWRGEAFYMQDNVGLMISLTVYVAWMVFFSCLICVQRPIPRGLLDTVGASDTGSLRATFGTLLVRMFSIR